ENVRFCLLVRLPKDVVRVTVHVNCRPSGDDVGVALQNECGAFAFQLVQHGGLAIDVIQILQLANTIGLRLSVVGLGLDDRGGRSRAKGSRSSRLKRAAICLSRKVSSSSPFIMMMRTRVKASSSNLLMGWPTISRQAKAKRSK